MANMSDEAAKLQHHLDLLREQYVRLQQRYSELEQKYTRSLSNTADLGQNHFVTKLVSLVSNLYEKPLYSDLTVRLADDRSFHGHRFVFVSRSVLWNPNDELLANTDSIDLSSFSLTASNILLKWLYTNTIMLPSDQTLVIELLSISNRYQLLQLKEKCEQTLMSAVTVRNCIALYQTSEEHSAQQLKKYCLQIISSRWNDLNTLDFANLTAPLLYEMFKAHSSCPLHLAVQHLREDVVFMFIIEHNTELPGKLNECDDHGNIPLNLALLYRNEAIANTLVSNKCDLDICDKDGNSLLHLAIMRGDEFAASFLIRNGASTTLSTRNTHETPLHLTASYVQQKAAKHLSEVPLKDSSLSPSASMSEVTSLLLEHHANPDAQDSSGYTPLQRAIECNNGKVFDTLLSSSKLNLEIHSNFGLTALWLAIKQIDVSYITNQDKYHDCFAAKLLDHGADPDSIDTRTGNSLLHMVIMEANEGGAIFLVCHGSRANHSNHQGEAPIHLAAKLGLHQLVHTLLQYGADPNMQTNKNERSATPAQLSARSTPMLARATSASSHSLTKTPPVSRGISPTLGPLGALSALSSMASTDPYDTGLQELSNWAQSSTWTQPTNNARPISSNPFDSDDDDNDNATPHAPPINTGPCVTMPNSKGYHLSPTHLENRNNTPTKGGSTPRNTSRSVSPEVHLLEPEFIEPPEKYDLSYDPGLRTALHIAVSQQHNEVVNVLLKYKDSCNTSGHINVALDVNIKDGEGDTPFSLSLWSGQFEIALKLLDSGADIECEKDDGAGLLWTAIVRELSNAALFLLNHEANFKKRTPNNETLLLAAIKHQLEPVADRLCDLGVDVSVADSSGNSPVWVALRSRQESIAAKLISQGCNPNGWHTIDNLTLSLLHRAIILKDTAAACFLIKSGADVNSPTKPHHTNVQYSSPLHMACERGLDIIVKCLVEHHAEPNIKDSEGRTPLHVAICCKYPKCSEILLSQLRLDLTLKDKQGQTPFAAALHVKDNDSGKAILRREPKAAEQMDNKGQNFLHVAILNQDIESVIYLLSLQVDVNSKVQNPTKNTPLHYAVKTGAEIIVRHLLLALADVEAVDNHGRCVLHMAVEGGFPNILAVLLEHGAVANHQDEEGNNALHIAMQLGHVECARILIEDSKANLLAINGRGRNCLHMLCANPSSNASTVFAMLKNEAPNYPLDQQDDEGNTPLLLAYMGGNTALCDALVQAHAHPSICNRQNVSIFNAPVATKQLLFRLLDQIHNEPAWLEGQNCMECGTKFNISHRKHHCRHCGRLLCNKCTSQQVSIVKFDLNKPVRVCEICSDLFRLGAMH